jgi:phage shock protein C
MDERRVDTPTIDQDAPEGGESSNFVPPKPRGQRLFRGRRERMIGGVCGGLGEYFNLDPVLFRLGFLILAFSGTGILAYLVLWLIVPEYPIGAPELSITSSLDSRSGRVILAWALFAFGLLLLANNLGLFSIGSSGQFWPLLLIVAGAALLLNQRSNE